MTTEEQALQQRAAAGDAEAQFLLARGLDNQGQHEQALQWLHAAANTGLPAAQHVLGSRLLIGRAAPYEPQSGAQWVAAAASQGLPESLALMSVLATLEGDWPAAVQHLRQAADRGDARAAEQVRLLGSTASFNTAQWDAPLAPAWKFQSPRVAVLEQFLPRAFCEWIVRRAEPKLQAARLKGTPGGAAAGHRTSSGAGFSLVDADLILQMVNGRIADAIGVPMVHQEPSNVLRYRPGEEYKAHFDFITESEANRPELAAVGQRVCTLLIYLNEGYEGGETEFPALQWKYKGRPGDALMFWNVGADGQPDRQTLHAGLPVTQGEKWLFSKWVRARPYPLL